VSRNYIDYQSFKDVTSLVCILLICPHKMEGQLRTLAVDPGGIHDATATAGSVLSGDFEGNETLADLLPHRRALGEQHLAGPCLQ
jgi:hypothetical protein